VFGGGWFGSGQPYRVASICRCSEPAPHTGHRRDGRFGHRASCAFVRQAASAARPGQLAAGHGVRIDPERTSDIVELASPKSIKKVINYCKKNRNNFVVNAYTDIKNEEEFRSSSVPKIIIDNKNNLLFVTRSPSPTNKKFNFIKAFKQVCIYAYPRNSLLKLKKNKKGFLERIEDIEILRFVENGIKVKMIKVQGSELAIDEKKDVIAAIKLFDKNE
jgi:hypothetical protein